MNCILVNTLGSQVPVVLTQRTTQKRPNTENSFILARHSLVMYFKPVELIYYFTLLSARS